MLFHILPHFFLADTNMILSKAPLICKKNDRAFNHSDCCSAVYPILILFLTDSSLCLDQFQASHRTSLYTGSASGTLCVIHMCKIVCHGNCLGRAALLALHTADASVGALFPNHCTLLLIGAGHCSHFLLRKDLDQMIRAGSHAHTAGNTLLSVDMGDALLNADGIIFTNLLTIPTAQATVSTCIRASVKHFGGSTGIDSLIL